MSIFSREHTCKTPCDHCKGYHEGRSTTSLADAAADLKRQQQECLERHKLLATAFAPSNRNADRRI